jgi:hypothetical protein
MLTKKELYKKVLEKFDRKLSIDFWFDIFFIDYEKEELTEKEMFALLADVNKNET